MREGAFNGRINKLVDSCYNFWVGACFEMLDVARGGKGSSEDGRWLYNQLGLQGYTVLGCQTKSGGLKDKPFKHPDLYHTCYSLAGLSIAQHRSDH